MITMGLTLVASVFNFWNKLPPTIKVLLLLLTAAFTGFLYGQHVANVKCEAQKQESIAEARRIDTEANKTRELSMKADIEKYRNQSLVNENKLNEATESFQTLKTECRTDEDFIRRNNDDDNDVNNGVPNKVPGHPAHPAGNSKRSAHPDNVPKGETQRGR